MALGKEKLHVGGAPGGAGEYLSLDGDSCHHLFLSTLDYFLCLCMSTWLNDLITHVIWCHCTCEYFGSDEATTDLTLVSYVCMYE
jgi:hypothetical protein